MDKEQKCIRLVQTQIKMLEALKVLTNDKKKIEKIAQLIKVLKDSSDK